VPNGDGKSRKRNDSREREIEDSYIGRREGRRIREARYIREREKKRERA